MIAELRNKEWPDACGDGVSCCIGHAVYGPGGCTCWEPVYDQPQAPHNGSFDAAKRPTLCHDCAYRNGSPERVGAKGYSGNEEMLEELVATGRPFWCHQGLRKIVAWEHPNGMTIPAHDAAYDPLEVRSESGAIVVKADGTPGDLCGGWCAKRKRKEPSND